MTGTLTDQALPLAVRTAGVFFLNAGHPDDGANMMVPAVDRNDSPEQHQRIDAICLHAPSTAIHLKARWIQDPALDTSANQPSRQPKAIVSCFVADHDPVNCPGRISKPYNQGIEITPSQAINAWFNAIWMSD
jgi:hypothetical protein